jgi:biotin carboxyl carrier protein
LVTVFGAGVTGLSAAHELVERGFEVQVVEPNASEDFEYECEVGGMAANQFGRIKETRLLHPYLFPEERFDYLRACEEGNVVDEEAAEPLQGNEDKEQLLQLRNLRLLPVRKRFGFPWRILFDRSLKDADDNSWLSIADSHLEGRWKTNSEKVQHIVREFARAYQHYLLNLEEEIRLAKAQFGSEPQLSDRMRRREILLIEIIGHTDDSEGEKVNLELGLRWANLVRDKLASELLKKNRRSGEAFYDPGGDPSKIRCHLVARSEGSRTTSADGLGDPPVRRLLNRVELRVLEHVVPGDHGYRFFPAYYRHIFDLMKRTPILDRRGVETARTAFDQLALPPPVAVALKDTDHFKYVGRHRMESIEELKRGLEVFLRDMKLQERDLQRYQAQLIKFLTSCPERRRSYEELSWLHFADARKEWEGPSSDIEAKGYSKRAEKLLREVSQALIAMAAEETDALTHGTTSTQLLLDYLKPPANQTDLTLNGPTSLAWLRPWKRYLRRQGVRFFVGSLQRFWWNCDEEETSLQPIVRAPDDRTVPWREERGYTYRSHQSEERPDFYVLALPYEQISDLVWDAHHRLKKLMQEGRIQRWTGFEGDFRKLMEFDIQSRRRTRDGEKLPLERDENGLPVDRFHYPLRDLSGIQYFFANSVRLGEGHLVFPDSPWGLSSISQTSHWRSRPSHTHGFLGQLSVDIGDFYHPYDFADLESPRSAWNCTGGDIAEGVWRQTLEGVGYEYARTIERPAFYHLDDGVNFGCREIRAPKVLGIERGAVLKIGTVKEGNLERNLKEGDVVEEGEVIATVALPGESSLEVKSPMWGVLGEGMVSEDDIGVERRENRIASIRADYELRFGQTWTITEVTAKKSGDRVQGGEHLLTISCAAAGATRIGLKSPAAGTLKLEPISVVGSEVQAGRTLARVELGGKKASHDIRVPDKARVKKWVKSKWDKVEKGKNALIARMELVPPLSGKANQEFELFTPLNGRLVQDCGNAVVQAGDLICRLQSEPQEPKSIDGEEVAPRGPIVPSEAGVWTNLWVTDARPPGQPLLEGKLTDWHVRVHQRVRYGDPLCALCFNLDSPIKGVLHRDAAARSKTHRVKPEGRLGEVCVDARVKERLVRGRLAFGAVDNRKWVSKDAPLLFLTVPVECANEGEVEHLKDKDSDVHQADLIAKVLEPLVAKAEGELKWAESTGTKVNANSKIATISGKEVKADFDGTLQWSIGDGQVDEGQRIGEVVVGEILSPQTGKLHAWLVSDGAHVEAATKVAVILPPGPESTVRSKVSGAVKWKWKGSKSGSVRPWQLTHEDEIEAWICSPISAPLFTPAVDEFTLTWLIDDGKEVGKGDCLAQIFVDVLSPASGRLETVFEVNTDIKGGEVLGYINDQTPAFNRSPFMINLPGQWKHRPGLERRRIPVPPGRLGPDVTAADKEIVYTVSHDRYVMAGNFMATLTRLSTMESANESARHAVNAILWKLASCTDSGQYNGAGRLLGDYVRVWNPERHELPDLDPLKRLDKALFDAKVPHFIDVLRIPEIIDEMGLYEEIGDYPVRNLAKLLEMAPSSFAKEWEFLPTAADRSSPIATLDRHLREASGSKEISDWVRELVQICLRPPRRRSEDTK